jgi:glutamyl-tRNA synthetase
VTPRLRFAPSPTGYLHVGGARTALFNWLYVRRHHGVFVLRIEDTDVERSSADMVTGILHSLKWLGLDWDEGPHIGGPHAPYFQTGRLDQYRRAAGRLVASGDAYFCYCRPDDLKARREAAQAEGAAWTYDRTCRALSADEIADREAAGLPRAIRFLVPPGRTAFDDLVHGPIEVEHANIEDFVILRSDGTPIYNLAVVSDDIDMRITLVMRGDDHISNTPKQILLYQALGHTPPRFAHVPMIHGLDGKKLSKRHGATAVADYQNEGILPGAMVNFLALMGWSPGGDREVMSLEEMVSLFSLDGLQKKAAVFDTKKLEWMNGQHLSRTPAAELEPLVTPALVAAGLVTAGELAARRDWYLALLDLLKVRARLVQEITRQAFPYFAGPVAFDTEAVSKQWKDRPGTAELLAAAKERLAALPQWTPEAMEGTLRALAEERGLAGGKIFQPLRVALTGMAVSPGIFEVLSAMGRDLALARIDGAIAYLGNAPAA